MSKFDTDFPTGGDVYRKKTQVGIVYFYKDNLGTDIFFANDAGKNVAQLFYVKRKEILLNEPPEAALSLKFGMKVNNIGCVCSAQIYRNGAAVGTLRTTNSIVTVYFTETIGGWSDGDKFQIYAKISDVTWLGEVSTQQILCTKEAVALVANDP